MSLNKSCWYRSHFSFFSFVKKWGGFFALIFSFSGDEIKLFRTATCEFEFRKIIFSYFFIVATIQEEVLPPPPLFSLSLCLVDSISHSFWISSISCLHSSPPFFLKEKFISLWFSPSSPTPLSSFCFGRPPFLSNLSNSIGWGGEVRVDPPTWVIIQCYFRNVVLSWGQNMHLQKDRKEK